MNRQMIDVMDHVIAGRMGKRPANMILLVLICNSCGYSGAPSEVQIGTDGLRLFGLCPVCGRPVLHTLRHSLGACLN